MIYVYDLCERYRRHVVDVRTVVRCYAALQYKRYCFTPTDTNDMALEQRQNKSAYDTTEEADIRSERNKG